MVLTDLFCIILTPVQRCPDLFSRIPEIQIRQGTYVMGI
jgi:hypothetical protein